MRQRFVVGVNLFLWVMYRRWCWYLWQLRWFVKLVSEATRQLDEENSKLSTPFKMSSKGGELISKKKSGWTKRRNSRMTFKMTLKMTFLQRRKSIRTVLPLLLLTFSAGLARAGGATLKGVDLSCNQPDGNDVNVPGITDTKDLSRLSIRCICYRKVVKCERQINSCATKLQGCHYVEDVDVIKSPSLASSACSQECRSCVVNGTKHESGKLWKDKAQGPIL